MTKVKLNGSYMYSRDRAHQYLQWKLNSPQYHGNNLDALWDVLSTYSTPITFSLTHKELLLTQLGDYGQAIIQTFQDAAQENGNIHFEITGV